MSQNNTPDHGHVRRQRLQSLTSSPRKRSRETTTNEKEKVLAGIEQVEYEIQKLQQLKEEYESRSREILEVMDDSDQVGDDCGDTEGLEALLRDMDDGDLAALLTQGVSATSIDTVTPYFSEAKMLIPAPAKSAGIEGTGGGLKVDEEAERLKAADGNPGDTITEMALQGRVDRGKELLQHLAQFAMIDFYKISSTAPLSIKNDPSSILRTITMTGRTPDLGDIQVSVEVQEDVAQEVAGESPEIVNLTVDIEGEELYRALGDAHLRNIVNDRNLPAILLSIRTIIPLARTRLRLYRSIYAAFPSLCQESTRSNKALHLALTQSDDSILSSHVLIDPDIMEILTLQNENDTKLDIIFRLSFNRWGHASPQISLQPRVNHSSILSKSARATLNELPAHFDHMCKHITQPYDAGTALVTIIQAFFDLP